MSRIPHPIQGCANQHYLSSLVQNQPTHLWNECKLDFRLIKPHVPHYYSDSISLKMLPSLRLCRVCTVSTFPSVPSFLVTE